MSISFDIKSKTHNRFLNSVFAFNFTHPTSNFVKGKIHKSGIKYRQFNFQVLSFKIQKSGINQLI